jgi:predicted enzyme related to lactoylglutathione lyase
MTDVRDAPTTQRAEERPKTGGYIWYELMTSDAEAAKDFYDALIGWNVQKGPDEYGTYRVIGRSDGGYAGGLMPITDEMAAHGARPTWLGYIHVADVDEAVSKIEGAGGKTLMAATDIQNVGRIAMVTDPQGAPFYVMKPNPPANDPNAQSDVFSPSAQQRCGWNELSSSDPAAARRFYGEQFGWTSDDFMPMGEMGEYRFLKHGDLSIGAIAGTMDGQPSHWRYYFRVPSISKAKETAEAKGGTIRMGPHQVPTGEYIIIGTDPQGAEFALVGGE